MCVVPESLKRNSLPSESISMDREIQNQKGSFPYSKLLELSASNDLIAFKQAVEEDGVPINEADFWYGRRIGSRKMGYEQRTPLMIATMFGSTDVVKYILSTDGIDVNKVCGSDGATALHCATAGGSASASEIVKLLIEASADVSSLDAYGNQPGDVVPSYPTTKLKSLEMMLAGISSSTGDGQQPTSSSQNNGSLDGNLLPLEEQVSGKKEYPVDFSMPDVNTGIYGTDEFRMYTFKVKPCSRAYSHDWTECPFVHPGENARRRDPRKYSYSCVPCPEFRKGACRLGDACEYAHGVFESWLHPWQYRTRLCKDEAGCTRKVCFFAHKQEELRPSHASVGSAMLSPRSSSTGALSLDMAALSPLALGSPSVLMPTSTPMSPSSSSWQNMPGVVPPMLQLPLSRLKSALSARDMGLEMEMVGLEGYQQQLMDEMSNLSGRSSTFASAAALAGSPGNRSGKFSRVGAVTPSNLEDVFGSLDSPSMSQLQGISMNAAAAASQFHSSGVAIQQNMNQQLHSYYSGSLSSSPGRTSLPSSSFGLDPSLATAAAAVMNSRSAAFAKRSQSFSERVLMNRHPGLTTMATTTTETMLSDWGSPNGKVDWGIKGDELNKMRKSASFGIRSSTSIAPAAAAAAGVLKAPAVDEPDVLWVQSLVKDNTSTSSQQQQQTPLNHLDSGDELHYLEMLSPWAEQEKLAA